MIVVLIAGTCWLESLAKVEVWLLVLLGNLLPPLPFLIFAHALGTLRLNLFAPLVENEGNQQYQSDDEEPDELSSNALCL